MSIRVAIVQPSLARYRLAVFQELARRPGIDFTLVYAQGNGLQNVEPEGFNAIHRSMTVKHVRGHPIYWQREQIEFASKSKSDVIVMNFDAHYASAWAGLARAKMNGVGTVLWGHGYSRNQGMRKRIRQSMGRRADVLLLYSFHGRQLYLDAGFDPQRVFVAPNSIDRRSVDEAIAHHRANPTELETFRRDHQIDRRPLLLFVARLMPQRRVDLLIEAAALIKDRSFQIALVGEGPDEFVNTLKDHAGRAGVEDRIRFVGGVYDERELAKYFLSARAFVFPSFIGLSIHHAMSYSLPVVITEDRSFSNPEIEVMIPDQTGLTYRDNDAADLARQVTRLLDDESLARKLGTTGRSRLDSTWNVPNMVDGMVQAIESAHRRKSQR